MKSVKTEKQISETAVIKYVQNQFNPASKEAIQKCIENLIEREYICRDETNHQLLQYNI